MSLRIPNKPIVSVHEISGFSQGSRREGIPLIRLTIFRKFSFFHKRNVSLANDEVHVWHVLLDQAKSRLSKLSNIISRDERLRAERFYFERDRTRFVIARGVLRTILGQYMNIEPNHLEFSYEPQGKPTLAQITKGHPLCFNMSHSNDLALFAVTWYRKVGVDVEFVRPVPDAEAIAKRFFSPGENAALSRIPADKKLEAFFKFWTCKEAFLKAMGHGITRPMDRIEISLAPGEPARLLSVDGDLSEASRWSLWTLEPAPGYIGALAVEGSDLLLARD